MSIPPGPSLADPAMDDGERPFDSRALGLFVEHLAQDPSGEMLDLGPVCGRNIAFFAARVLRLHVFDLLLRLERDLSGEKPPDEPIRRLLDYPARTFQGVQLWHLADHLTDDLLGELVHACRRLLKPRGLLMLIARGERAGAAPPRGFAVREGLTLEATPQPGLGLPFQHRHNSEIIGRLSPPFSLAKSFIYRNGTREFLFRRPG